MATRIIMKTLARVIPGAIVIAVWALPVHADVLLTPHPLIEKTHDVVSKQLGDFGESVIGAELRARGFEVFNGNVKGTGIDRVAAKRGPGGMLTDIRLVDVKTHQTIPDFRLGTTKMNGPQLSDTWIRNNLKRIVSKHADANARRLATEVLDQMQSQPQIIKRELHGIAVDSNRYVVMSVDASGRIRSISSDGRLTDLLKGLATRGGTLETRAAALQHLAKFDQIKRGARGAISESSTISSVSADGLAGIATRTKLRGARVVPAMRGAVIVKDVNAAKHWGARLASKPGVLAAGFTLIIDESFTAWEYHSGTISGADFQRQSAQNGVKASFVGIATQLVYVLVPTPGGLVLVGVGIVAYVAVEQGIKVYDSYAIPAAPSASELRGIAPEWAINTPMISDFASERASASSPSKRSIWPRL